MGIQYPPLGYGGGTLTQAQMRAHLMRTGPGGLDLDRHLSDANQVGGSR
jgi:hypothetical protein